MSHLSKDCLCLTHPGLSASVAGIDMLQQSSNNLAVLWKQLYYLILWPLLGPETWHWHCYFGNRISVLGAFLRVSISNRARAPGSASEAPCLHQHLSRKIWYLLCLSGARPDHQFSYLEVACPPYRGISLRPAHQRLNWLQFPKVTSETRNAVTWICLSWQGWAGLQGVFLPVLLLLFSRSVTCNSTVPTYCSPPGSSIHQISQERILKWVAIPFSRESSHVVVVQSSSLVWFSATTWIAACRVSLSFTISWSLLKLMSIELAMPSNHLLSLPSPCALNLSQHQGLFQWVDSLHQVAKVLELQLQHQSFQSGSKWLNSTLQE